MPRKTSASRNHCLLRAEAYTAAMNYFPNVFMLNIRRENFSTLKNSTVGINGSVKSMQYSSRKEIPGKVIIPTLPARDSEIFFIWNC